MSHRVEQRKLHHLADGPQSLLPDQTVGPGEKIQILVDIDVLIRAEVIGHEAQPPSHAVRVVDHREAVHKRVARGRLVERRQDPHASRFAGSVRADVTEHLAGVHFERHIVDRVRLFEHAMQATKLNLWRSRADHPYHFPSIK